jgi:putative membrane protein insertion efficiency factor
MSALLQSLPQRLLLALVRGYRFAMSPWLGSSCRFEPTCSAYALQALGMHGASAGSYLTLRRLARCHPWCPGGLDPVPDGPARWFSRPDSSRLASSFTASRSGA